MARPIKFRAWEKEVKDEETGEVVFAGRMNYDPIWQDIKAVHVYENNRAGQIGKEVVKSHVAKLNDLFKPEHNLMQFTGLLDKNGKEVYEGDVVRCDVGDDREGCPHVVEYVMDIGGEYGGGLPGFALHGLLRNGGKGYAWAGREEVIGNIYENPELLKV